jgi:hypothetical protein
MTMMVTVMVSTPLQLATHGLSRKDLDVLRSLLLLYRSRLSREYRLCCDNDSDGADLHLIDVDDLPGRMLWESLRAKRQCIVYSRNTVETPLLLGKPLRGSALLAVLSEASYRTKQASETSQAGRPLLQSAAEVSTARHEPGKPLIFLLEAGAIDTQVRIVVPNSNGEDDLWIDPELRQYLFGAMLTQLRAFLSSPLRPEQMRRVSRQEFREHAQHVRPKTLTRLQWFSALACSEGELLPSLSRSAVVQLTAWPDMEGHSPTFFRLAGLLIKQAATFDEIVKMTGIDAPTTADFVNASFRSGLMRQVSMREHDAGFTFTGRHIVARLRERLGL